MEAAITFTRGAYVFLSGGSWASKRQDFQCLVTTNRYTPNKHHRYVRQVISEIRTGNVCRMPITGRKVLPNGDCMAEKVKWTDLHTTEKVSWLVIYRFVTSDADSELIFATPMNEPLAGVDDWTVRWEGQRPEDKLGRVFSIR